MKIRIREAGGRRITIPAPMFLVKASLMFGNVGMRIARRHVDKETLKYIEAVDLRLIAQNFNELSRYKGLRIVDVKSSSGDEVIIEV